MSEELSAADILEKAADLIQTVGHCKGSFSRWAAGDVASGPTVVAYCALGAIDAAGQNDAYILSTPIRVRSRRHNEAIDALGVELAGSIPFRGENVIAVWNDNEDRTPEEVIDLMKHVAKDLRNRGSDA
jgi:hypothetical protein